MITRTSHGWQYLALFLVTFHFAVPWLLLLSRDRKRTPQRLVIVAAVAAVRALRRSLHDGVAGVCGDGRNLHAYVGEGEHVSHFFVHWLDLAAPLAIGGLWLWMFFTQLRQRPLLAVGDPYLRESLPAQRRPLMAHARRTCDRAARVSRSPPDANTRITPRRARRTSTPTPTSGSSSSSGSGWRFRRSSSTSAWACMYRMLVEQARTRGAAVSAGAGAGTAAAAGAAAAAVPGERDLSTSASRRARV